MKRWSGKRVLLRCICIPVALLLLGSGPFLRAGLSEQDATATPAETPDLVVLCTPAPATPTAEPTPTPAPTPTPTAEPTPTATPEPPVSAAQLAKAAEELNAYRSPNRLKSAQIDEILELLPEGLPLARTLIVVKAYSLVGKVPYRWGGKSRKLGWDSKWGKETATLDGAEITAGTGGLDCSGFVRWCYVNASGTMSTAARLGSGTYKQWLNSKDIPLDEALPGDMLFTNEVGRTNHNGIVVRNNGDGDILVIHCVKGKGVVLESAKDAEFRLARRADLLWGNAYDYFEANMLRHRNDAGMADLRYLLALRGRAGG